ncbi:hypothetical protein [Nocardioides sp. LS1]|uniref:hypothetical protein n=1 Tax=Nocardioides sp. LS1 TaxID=1027620 RepID=UPI000F6229C3|nr:hypothetical protein [Nocardioides sp. LS1]GCD88521.1 hypothetical protein NLS1_05270 [Nocardioides sp. LS1]
MDLTRLTIPQRISLGSMVVVAIAAFLPWVSIFGLSARGTEGDGIITLVLSVVGLVVLMLTSGALKADKSGGKISQIALVVMAAIVALIGLFDMNGAAAIGLYLTLFAGLAWVVGAIWQLSVSKSIAATPEVTD